MSHMARGIYGRSAGHADEPQPRVDCAWPTNERLIAPPGALVVPRVGSTVSVIVDGRHAHALHVLQVSHERDFVILCLRQGEAVRFPDHDAPSGVLVVGVVDDPGGAVWCDVISGHEVTLVVDAA